MVTFYRWVLTMLFVAIAQLLLAQNSPEERLLAFESNRFQAMVRADTAALSPMLAPELHYLHSNALLESKTQHLQAIAARKLVYQQMERTQAQVRFYGKTGVVNGTLKVKGILQEKNFELSLAYTAVYRKKGKQWQLVNWQSTKQ